MLYRLFTPAQIDRSLFNREWCELNALAELPTYAQSAVRANYEIKTIVGPHNDA
jgi:hypothetical protein